MQFSAWTQHRVSCVTLYYASWYLCLSSTTSYNCLLHLHLPFLAEIMWKSFIHVAVISNLWALKGYKRSQLEKLQPCLFFFFIHSFISFLPHINPLQSVRFQVGSEVNVHFFWRLNQNSLVNLFMQSIYMHAQKKCTDTHMQWLRDRLHQGLRASFQ